MGSFSYVCFRILPCYGSILLTSVSFSKIYSCLLSFLYRYGELQGLNKQETADRFGKEQVHEWRRSYDIPPPKGESLEMCAQRAVAYFKEHVSVTFPFKYLMYISKWLILLYLILHSVGMILFGSPFLHE